MISFSCWGRCYLLLLNRVESLGTKTRSPTPQQMTKGNQMDFFNTLPVELQKQAIQGKMDDLYDNWYDAYISEGGNDLPFYVEEQLIEYLPEPIKELAVMFYEKQENANA